MTPIDEAALKAGISDEEIEAIAMQCCGELHGDELHMKRHQRIAFARALLHRSQPVAVVPAEQAEDSAMLDWLEKNLFERKWGGTIGAPSEFYVRGDFRHTTQKMRGETLREAIRAAMSNREAGGS